MLNVSEAINKSFARAQLSSHRPWVDRSGLSYLFYVDIHLII